MSTSSFGSSAYGERFDFSTRKCRDPLFAVIYMVHILGLIYSLFHIYLIDYNEMNASQWQKVNDINSLNWSGSFLVIPVCILSGLLFGTIWLLFIRKCSQYVIQTMLMLNIIAWTMCFIVGLSTFNLALLIIGIVVGVVYAIQFTWFAFYRIPFSTDLLVIGNHILNDYFARKRDQTISLMLALIVLCDIGFLWLWGASFYGYILISIEAELYSPDAWIVFFYLLSLYWGLSVNSMTNHALLSGVIAAAYFHENGRRQIAGGFSGKLVMNMLLKQYGSICLAASLVPLMEATRAFFNSFILQERENSVVGCACLFCVNCLEYLYGKFNQYSFVFMAVYGESCTKSAEKVHKLLSRRAISKCLLVDDITGIAIFSASLVCCISSSAVAYGVAYIFYGQDPDKSVNTIMPMELSMFGGVIGLVMCLAILRNVRTAIVALWVCFADDPSKLEETRPEILEKLMQSHPKFASLNMRIVNDHDVDNEDGGNGDEADIDLRDH